MDCIIKNGIVSLQRRSILEQLEERIVLDAAVPAAAQDNLDNDSGVETEGGLGSRRSHRSGRLSGRLFVRQLRRPDLRPGPQGGACLQRAWPTLKSWTPPLKRAPQR